MNAVKRITLDNYDKKFVIVLFVLLTIKFAITYFTFPLVSTFFSGH